MSRIVTPRQDDELVERRGNCCVVVWLNNEMNFSLSSSSLSSLLSFTYLIKDYKVSINTEESQ